jgi:hypothetical protein
MIPRLLLSIFAILPVAACGQSGGFQQLVMQPGKDTAVAQYSLRLADPDNPDKPGMWQGPLTITDGSASCTEDVSLVTAVYAAPGRSFVIVISASGSNAIAHFIALASCAEKWQPIKHAASSVKVAGNRLSFLPVCEGGGNNAPALCTSARVYAIHVDSPPAYLSLDSYKLTEKELGVGFIGEAKVMDPHSPRAMVVH